MWRLLRSPRRVLASVLAAGVVCLCCMIPYAYWDRPRVEIESVDQSWMDLCLAARVTAVGETYVYQTWICANRKDGPHRDDKLSVHLNSAAFFQKYRKAAIERHDRLSDLFQTPDTQRLCFDANDQTILF
jgi:hypothetical protein